MNRNRQIIKMTRREWLKIAGASMVAGRMSLAVETATRPAVLDLRAMAEKNFKLGIFTGVYGELPVEQAASRIKEAGFSCVVLQYHFADVGFDFKTRDWNDLKKIRRAFKKQGLRIAGLFGYYNVVDSNEERRKKGESKIHLLIKEWKRFGTPIVSLETGSFHPDSEFMDVPENFTEKAYQAVRVAMEKLVKAAEKSGAVVTIEPYWRNVICSAEKAERLFKDIQSPSLKLVMDPCNYYRNEDLPKMGPVMEDLFKRIGHQTAIAHAKDVKAADKGPDLPAAGLGELDYKQYLRLLAGLNRDMDLVIEHLTLPDVPRATGFVKAQVEKL